MPKTKSQIGAMFNNEGFGLSAKKGKMIKATTGAFAQKMQPYDGSYVQGDLAGQKVSNPSLVKYYKDLIK